MKREDFAKKINWEWIIWAFGLLNVGAMLPQLIRLIVTQKTEGLSIEMFILYGVIQLALSLDGFFKRNTMLCVCMALSAAVSATIIGIILFLR